MSEQTSNLPAATPPGLIRRMGTTPLRDALRGRLTGRLDIPHACALAKLHPTLTDLVIRTVRRTRLWRVERAEVGAELIAHFRDGLDAGRPPEELATSFGQVAIAARLIRSAKQRSRSLLWKSWIGVWKTVAAFLVLCVLTYAFLFIRYHTGRSVLRLNIVQELNAPVLGIPAEDRAWTVYKDAIRAYQKLPDELTDVRAQWPQVPADSPFRAAALANLEQNRATIERLHAAAAIPRLGYVLSDRVRPDDPWYDPANDVPQWEDPEWQANPPAIGILLPSLGEFRKFAMLLCFDSMIAREQGDAERVRRNICTTIAMAEHARDLPFLISDLVGLALVARACEEINLTLHEAPDLLTNDQLVALAHTLSAFPRAGGELVRFDDESRFFEDTLQRVYTDDGSGNGHISAKGARLMQMLAAEYGAPGPNAAIEPLATALMADRAAMKREHDAITSAVVSAAHRPLWTWTENPDAAFQVRDADFLWRQRYAVIGSLMPALGKTALSQHRFTQIRDATLVAVSLTLSRRQTGVYPATLDALTPNLLPSIPPDIFDGAPLRYALVDGSPVIYSVGVDRKDDGGRAPKNPNAGLASTWKPREQVDALMAVTTSREPIDGDWVLYPPLPPLPPPPPEDEDE